MALAGTILYIAKLALALTGSDDMEAVLDDVELDMDMDLDVEDTDLKFLSLQTILLFILSAGWIGIIANQTLKLSEFYSLFFAIFFGVCIAIAEVYLFARVKSLHQVHVSDPKTAMGQEGKVYLTIPENGIGEIQIVFSGSMKNSKAKSESGQTIAAFTPVKVVGVDEENVLIVTKL